MTINLPFRFDEQPLLWALPRVYTADECRNFVQMIEHAQPELATVNPPCRDQDRVLLDAPDFAADLLRRIRQELPERMGELRLHALNPRLRMYRYRTGQRFAPHMDHWHLPDARTVSLHTVLVYFNEDFDGGETRFSEQVDASIVPEAGMALIFQHKLRHEGCAVTRGVKYAMRTDVLYVGDSDIRLPQIASQ
jgi:prolyl 4-hydroxylase